MVSFTNVVLAAGLASSIAAAPLAMIAVSVASSFVGKREDGLVPGEFSFLEDRAAPAIQGKPQQPHNKASATASAAVPTGTSGASGNAGGSVQEQFKGCVESMKKNKPVVKKNKQDAKNKKAVVTISNLSADCITAIKAYNARPDIVALRGKQGTAKLTGANSVVLTDMPANVVDALDG